jgi:hypothetical protein
MREGIQTFLQEAGEAACYALDIIKIAEEVTGREPDIVASLLLGVDRGYIHYSWNNPNDNDNFYVEKPAEYLAALTGKPCRVRKVADVGYKAGAKEYTVQCWQRNKTGYLVTHFRRPAWDSLVSSVTVSQGKLESLRIFTVE